MSREGDLTGFMVVQVLLRSSFMVEPDLVPAGPFFAV